MALDPNDRKDNDARRLRIGIDITAAAHRAVPFWKLHDDSHAPSSREDRAGFYPGRRVGRRDD